MIYGSVCSGIGCAELAFQQLGWRCAFMSEIEDFPRAVLRARFPDVPLHGDFTTIREDEYAAIDLLVGGTPCQSFSVAGLRGGLDDDRGNLALEFLRLVDRTRPRWVVWENVPGVLSSVSHAAPDPSPPPPPVDLELDGQELETQDEYDGQELHAFECFLAGLSELGYGVAWAVLDAQHFGVPQRRRRVFVVGHSGGSWQRAAAVLFERASLRGDPPPSREARKDPADAAPGGSGSDGSGGGLSNALTNPGRRYDGESDTFVVGALAGHHPRQDLDGSTPVVAATIGSHARASGADTATIVAGTLNANGKAAGSATSQDAEAGMLVVAHSLRGEGHDASEDGSGRGVPLAIDLTQATNPDNRSQPGTVAGTLAGSSTTVTFTGSPDLADPISAHEGDTYTHEGDNFRMHNTVNQAARGVRRLTPLECERLQGLPPGHTAIEYGGKPAADSPRYRAVGNGMAVPVLEWLARRIEAVDRIPEEGP